MEGIKHMTEITIETFILLEYIRKTGEKCELDIQYDRDLDGYVLKLYIGKKVINKSISHSELHNSKLLPEKEFGYMIANMIEEILNSTYGSKEDDQNV